MLPIQQGTPTQEVGVRGEGSTSGLGATSRLRRPRLAALAVLAVLVAATAACGEIEDQSMCGVYEDFLDERAVVADLDPEALSAQEAAEVAEGYRETVQRLQEVAERHLLELARLEESVSDVLRTLESVPDDADFAVWAPLVEDSLEDAADAAVTVEDIFEPQCPDADAEG
jgi:hypothetical protein